MCPVFVWLISGDLISVSMAVVLLLLIHCLLMLPLCGGSMFGPCFVMQFSMSFLAMQLS